MTLSAADWHNPWSSHSKGVNACRRYRCPPDAVSRSIASAMNRAYPAGTLLCSCARLAASPPVRRMLLRCSASRSNSTVQISNSSTPAANPAQGTSVLQDRYVGDMLGDVSGSCTSSLADDSEAVPPLTKSDAVTGWLGSKGAGGQGLQEQLAYLHPCWCAEGCLQSC